MKTTRQQEEVFTFILAPLIDVMLFILIFFMVSYNNTKSGLQNIALPSSDTSFQQEKKDNLIILELNKTGQFILDGKNYTLQQVSTVLSVQKNKPLILRADKSLSYQTIIDSMDMIKKAGITKIYLATI